MKIKTTGLKAFDRDLELQKLTFLTAPNASGKSAVSDAIRYAALGYIPALGKRPADTAVIIRNGRGEVEITLPDGRSIQRTIKATGKGYTTTADASWVKGKPSEHATAIRTLFGADEQDAAECLDIRELLAATPNQRAARIEALLKAGGPVVENLGKAVARRTFQRLADIPDNRMPEDYTALKGMLTAEHLAALEGLGSMVASKLTDLGIQGASTWANEEKRVAAQGLAQKKAAKVELEARLAQLPASDAAEISRKEKELETAQKDLGAAEERLAEARRREEEIGRAAKALAETERSLNLATEKRTAFLQKEKAVKKAAGTIGDTEAQISKLKAPEPPDYAEPMKAEKLAAELEQEAQDLAVPDPILDPGLHELGGRVMQLEAELGEAKDSSWGTIRARMQDLTGLISKLSRYKAGQQAKNVLALLWKDMESVGMDDAPRPVTTIEADLEKARSTLQVARDKVDKAKRQESDTLTQRAEKMSTASNLRDQAKDKRKEISDAYEEAQGAYTARMRQLTTHRDSFEAERSGLADEDRETASSVARAEAAFEASKQAQKTAGSASEYEAARRIWGQKEGIVRVLKSDLRVIQGAQAARRELEGLVAAIRSQTVLHEVTTAIEWAMQRVREEQITAAGGPLVERMTRFLDTAMGTDGTPYFRASSGVCEIGMRAPDGQEVQIQALSGGEWVLFAAALTSAVIALRHPPLRMLLVEAGECDAEALGFLMGGIEAVADDLDYALVISHLKAARAGWSIKTLSREVVKA